MSIIAVYNMKGGVGKTTAAVNLSYLAAAAGQRMLLWDLDPQAASSFAFRIQPHVEGFSGRASSAAAAGRTPSRRPTTTASICCQRISRIASWIACSIDLGKPQRVMAGAARDAGPRLRRHRARLPAGLLAADRGRLRGRGPRAGADDSDRALAANAGAADRVGRSRASRPPDLVAFLSMVDRRKTLHRRACEWSRNHPEMFLGEQVPYASVVEQMAVRRMPLNAFAPRDPAALAFAEIWAQVRSRLQQPAAAEPAARDPWASRLRAIETLLSRLETADDPGAAAAPETPVIDFDERRRAHRRGVPEDGPILGDADVVHRFDTDHRDLERRGYVLELHERKGSLMVAVTRLGGDDGATVTARAQAQIDGSWAFEILSGSMSPLTALGRRLGRPGPAVLEGAREIAGRGPLRRIESRSPAPAGDGPVTPAINARRGSRRRTRRSRSSGEGRRSA